MANQRETHYSLDPSTTPRLRYPTFPPLSRSVEEWLSQSRPSMSINNHPHDRPPSALSESWATLSTSDTHSEDGTRSEQTDIASLIDQNGPDDVASLDGQESSSYDDEEGLTNLQSEEGDVNNEEDREGAISESQDLPHPLFARDLPAGNDSGLTAKPFAEYVSESIEFSEPEKWPEMQRVQLKHTISILNDEDAAGLRTEFSEGFDDAQLAITVQQTMIKQGLNLDKPYHVLYMGDPEFRNIILDKIGDVLVSSSCRSSGSSSTESSRYHVVPTSFGVGATPNYAELLPIHVQLIVDECINATNATGRTPGSPGITLEFKNRPSCSSVWTGSEHQVQSDAEWSIPDLSICLVSERDDHASMRARHLAQSFMDLHGVPVLIISDEPLWKKPGPHLFQFDHQGLHLCLESRRLLTGETVVLERYPIDVKTFESITPSQLNRHLASLSSLQPRKSTTISVTSASPKYVERDPYYDAEKYPSSTLFSGYNSRKQSLAPLLRVIMLSIVAAISLSLGYTAIRTLAIYCLRILGGAFATSTAASVVVGNFTTTTTITPSTTTAGLVPLSLKSPSTDLSERLDTSFTATPGDFSSISKLLGDGPNKNDTFQFQIIGDCHVVIKQPAAAKGQRFDVKVIRRDTLLPYELARLFDGVYTLRLNREDAWGLVNVTVSTRSKQLREETLEVDFGTPWLKVENWKRAAHGLSQQIKKDIDNAQTGFSDLYARLSTDVQVWVGDAVNKSHSIRKEAESLHYNSGRQIITKLNNLTKQSKELRESIIRSVSRHIDAASEMTARAQKHSLALNKAAYTLIEDTAGFVNDRLKALGTIQIRISDVIPTEILDRAQKSAKKLTAHKFWPPRRP